MLFKYGERSKGCNDITTYPCEKVKQLSSKKAQGKLTNQIPLLVYLLKYSNEANQLSTLNFHKTA